MPHGDFTVPPGYDLQDLRIQCYCHGDRHKPPRPRLTDHTARSASNAYMVIQTTRLPPSWSDGTAETPNLGRADTSGADWSDAEHQARIRRLALEWRPGYGRGARPGGLGRSPSVLNLWDDDDRLLPTLGILLDPVGHPLTSRKGAAPGHKYRAVDEGTSPTVIWGNEAEPLDVIELLDDAGLPLN